MSYNIDIGSTCIDRDSTGIFTGTTVIDTSNSATASGIVNAVEVWLTADTNNFKIGTFYHPTGTIDDYGCGDTGYYACNVKGNLRYGRIGGGSGYCQIYTTADADYIATSISTLTAAFAGAGSGDVIYVGADIECSGLGSSQYYSSSVMWFLKAGAKLVSNRGYGGTAQGYRVYSTRTASYWGGGTASYTLVYMDDNSEVAGITLGGNDTGINNTWARMVIVSVHEGCEVHNCEISGGAYAGVTHSEGSGYVHHNYIHHNRRSGYGYGVQPIKGVTLSIIEGNHFDYSRHHFSGDRGSGVNYEFRYNYLGTGGATNTQIDQHGQNDGAEYQTTGFAGGNWAIHHNTSVYTGQSLIGIRGIPYTTGVMFKNWWYGASSYVVYFTDFDSVQHTGGPINQRMYNLSTANGYPTEYRYIADYEDPHTWVNVTSYGNGYGTAAPSESNSGIFICRSSVTIGAITGAGNWHQTVTADVSSNPIALTAASGDFIGWYGTTGSNEFTTTGGVGQFWVSGDYIMATLSGDYRVFVNPSGQSSIYATGTGEGGDGGPNLLMKSFAVILT